MDTTDRHGTPVFAIAASFDSACLISPVSQARISRLMNPPLRLSARAGNGFPAGCRASTCQKRNKPPEGGLRLMARSPGSLQLELGRIDHLFIHLVLGLDLHRKLLGCVGNDQ